MNPTAPILHVAMVEPDIAPNVGAIARTCAATGVRLHLIGRLGFRLTDRAVRRAGLDYWRHVDLEQHLDWEAFRAAHPALNCLAFSSRATRSYADIAFAKGDCIVFGSETRGLPSGMLHGPQALPSYSLPLPTGKVRSLNVAVAVGIVVYEAIRQWRQTG